MPDLLIALIMQLQSSQASGELIDVGAGVQTTVCLFQDLELTLELTSFPWMCVGRIKVGSSGFLAEGSPLGLA